MRLLRGPLAPSRDADATTSVVARPRSRPAAVLVLLALRPAPPWAWNDGFIPAELVPYLVVLLILLALVAAVWFLWVRAEVRALQEPAFLVLPRHRADRLAIAGAEPERVATPLQADLAQAAQLAVQQGIAPQRTVVADARSVAPLGGQGDVVVFAAGGLSGQPAALAADATLQFLPGRLVCVGQERRPDLRFVRQPGGATVITIGRANGEMDRHIHVTGPTVSRLHARLRYAAGRWMVSNLSTTNPMRVNGRALAAAVETCVLADGDRLELGELVFIFREK